MTFSAICMVKLVELYPPHEYYFFAACAGMKIDDLSTQLTAQLYRCQLEAGGPARPWQLVAS